MILLELLHHLCEKEKKKRLKHATDHDNNNIYTQNYVVLLSMGIGRRNMLLSVGISRRRDMLTSCK